MSRITILTLVLGVLLAAAILAIVILLVKVGQLARQIAEFPQRVKDVKAGPRASLTGNQRRIRDAIAQKRIAFDVYRPPETAVLTEAFLSGLPDDEAVFLADDELDQPPPGCDAIAGDAGDDLVPSPDEMIAGAP